ncbi:MAG: MATE family efflux transporter [Gemmobacter sp.]
MSLMASVGLMAVFLVDFVDMIFIAMLGKAELAAAVGYAGAILFFTASVGIGLGIAVGALVAQAIGRGDREGARARATHGLIHGIVFGTGFAALVWTWLPELVGVLGATGRTADLAVHYLAIIVPSQPLLMVGMIGGAILRAHGDARAAMMTTIYGGLVNAVLDPILIFGLDLELTGAALASVAARIAMAAVALRSILMRHGGLDRPTGRGLARDLAPVAAIAFPAILTQVATPVGQAFVTRAMATFGEEAVAGLAIVSRLTPVAFGVLFALSGAVGPIIGQNFGAGNMARVRRGFLDSLLFCAIVTVLIAGVLFALRGPIADLFNATGDARALVYLFCGPLALLWFFNGAIFAANAAFNNLGHPYYSTWTNWARHTVGTVPFVIVAAWGFGAPGVLIGQAVGGVLFGGFAIWLALRVIGGPRGGPPEPFGREGRLMSLSSLRR